MRKNLKGFTLIEILVVATIIGLLAAAAAVSYSSLTKNSRDARRKADVEQIRSALEMYRSNDANASYPVSSSNVPVGLSPSYIGSYPSDPKTSTSYPYVPLNSSGAACTGLSGNVCSTYSITATLENDPTPYVLGPYGK